MTNKTIPQDVTILIKSSAYFEEDSIYEGDFILRGTRFHKGKGTLYYPDGKTIKQEGIFQRAGLLEGREYYPNGNLRFEGKFNNKEKENRSYYGPTYPVEGRFYDEDGNLVYEGKTKIEHLGSLGYPKVVLPEGYDPIILSPKKTTEEAKTTTKDTKPSSETLEPKKDNKPDERFDWLDFPPKNISCNGNGFLASDMNGLMCDENALRNDLGIPNTVINEVLQNTANWFHLIAETSRACRHDLGEINEGMCCTDSFYWYEINEPKEFLKELRKVIKLRYLEFD